MAIPTDHDRRIAAIDDLAASVLLRLRVYHRAGPDRSPDAILEALERYSQAVRDLVGAHKPDVGSND